MYIFYEIINENPSNPDEELYEFVCSSDSRTSKIYFTDKHEKAMHTIVLQFFRTLPLSVHEVDATTNVHTVLGLNGKKFLMILTQAITTTLLVNVILKKVTDLTGLLAKGNLSWLPSVPKSPKTSGPQVEIKFNEEDFFYKPEASKGALSGEALFKALATSLDIEVSRLHILSAFDLKRIYRQRALALHPDRNNGDGSKMSELNSIWSTWLQVQEAMAKP